MGFVKATRKRAYLKIALTGPSGSGKTFSALAIARGLVGPQGRIAVLDTENGSASLYSNRDDYDTWELEPPFKTERYAEVIHEATQLGYDVLIIDSLTHAWAGEGGLLAQKEALDTRGGNQFSNWAPITKKQEEFKSTILQAPIHVIATMRSKQDYVLDQGGNGKTAPKKVGLAPIQRDGMEYEFTVVLDITMGHEAFGSKDRTGLFDGHVGVPTVDHGRKLRQWLEGGAVEAPAPAASPAVVQAPAGHPCSVPGCTAPYLSPKLLAESMERFGVALCVPHGRERLQQQQAQTAQEPAPAPVNVTPPAAGPTAAQTEVRQAKQHFTHTAQQLGYDVLKDDDPAKIDQTKIRDLYDRYCIQGHESGAIGVAAITAADFDQATRTMQERKAASDAAQAAAKATVAAERAAATQPPLAAPAAPAAPAQPLTRTTPEPADAHAAMIAKLPDPFAEDAQPLPPPPAQRALLDVPPPPVPTAIAGGM